MTVRNLRVWFDVRIGLTAGLLGKEQRYVRAVDEVSFDVDRGEVFCLVGESGCGKTTTGKALIRLNEPTSGDLFFDVPDDVWERFVAHERRLAELEATTGSLTPAERRKARADWRQIRRLTNRIERVRNPKTAARTLARRKRLEKSVELLDVREKGLREGEDARANRILATERERIEVMRTLGPWFTLARAHKLKRLELRLKEAKFRRLRAESTHAGVRRSRRLAARLERKIVRMQRRIRTDDQDVNSKIRELTMSLETKEKGLTQTELQRVAAEREEVRAKLARLASPQPPGADAQVRRLEASIAEVRARGGAGLQTLELRSRIDQIRSRYDLATWGRKDSARVREWMRERKALKQRARQLRRRVRGQDRAQALARRNERKVLKQQVRQLHSRIRGDRAVRIQGWRGRRRLLKQRMRQLRRRMQIIYQDPYESLNPKLSIFDIVAEPLLANRVVAQSEAEAAVAKALEDVGLRPASEYMFRYPHELSGGQRQRVGIATALVVDPDFIVADEPVSMLDASVRTEILALLLDLKKRRDLTYLFITHDLGLAWILADRLAVMYLGKVVETGNGPEIIQNPRHPYTKALISVVPSPNPSIHREKMILRGERPNPVDIPTGCRFHPRCPMAVGICGWDSQEVLAELETLLAEDRASFPEAGTVSEVTSTGPFGLRLATSDPAGVEKYLWKRLQAVALGRPALGAIRKAAAQPGALDLALHEPVEPALRRIRGNISVACHLVEPELIEAEVVAPETVMAK